MKPTSRLEGGGHTCIGPSIPPARRSSSCCRPSGTSPRRNCSCGSRYPAAGPRPRVINVDGHPAYASAVAELKHTGELARRCRCRTAPYLNNIIEQDHRFIKKRITASLGFRSVEGACRTIEGYEAMHAIRKGQIRWVARDDAVAQCQFIHRIFVVAA
jgi:DDE superfamily endonuclease